MDIRFGSFIWNAYKELDNIAKHGVDFERACQAFWDPQRIVIFDSRHSRTEERFFCIGKVDDRVLTVRFLYHKELVRIIGAAEWRKWRRFYERKAKEND